MIVRGGETRCSTRRNRTISVCPCRIATRRGVAPSYPEDLVIFVVIAIALPCQLDSHRCPPEHRETARHPDCLAYKRDAEESARPKEQSRRDHMKTRRAGKKDLTSSARLTSMSSREQRTSMISSGQMMQITFRGVRPY